MKIIKKDVKMYRTGVNNKKSGVMQFKKVGQQGISKFWGTNNIVRY